MVALNNPGASVAKQVQHGNEREESFKLALGTDVPRSPKLVSRDASRR